MERKRVNDRRRRGNKRINPLLSAKSVWKQKDVKISAQGKVLIEKRRVRSHLERIDTHVDQRLKFRNIPLAGLGVGEVDDGESSLKFCDGI